MRPVTLYLGGIKDPAVVAAFTEIQKASHDTLQNDSSSSGGAISTLVGATLGSGGPEIPYFTDQYHVKYLPIGTNGFPASGSLRLVLGGPTTFYVATNGSDSNNGLTSGTPWLTLAHAMAVITGQYDFGGQAITLQGVAGHAAFTSPLNVTPWTGGGSLTFDGGGGTIAATNVDAVNVTGTCPGTITFQNYTLSATGVGNGINVIGANNVNIGAGMNFGPCGAITLSINYSALLQILADFTISGGAQSFYQPTAGSTIRHQKTGGGSVKAALTGTPAFSTAFCVVPNAFISFNSGSQVVFSGPATGPRYLAFLNGVIFGTGGAPLYLPGSSAGSQSSGGQYV